MSTGLGSGQSESHENTADSRSSYDAKDLEEPMQKLVNFIAKYTRPGVKPGRFRHLADKRNPEQVMKSAQFAAQMGMEIPETWVRQQLGIPEAGPGDKILAVVQPQQSTALENVPAGTPQAGPSGPQPQGGQAPGGDEAAMVQQIQPVNS